LLVELLELKAHHAKAAESRTLLGHLRNALGYAMSGYCVYRVLASFKALLVGEDFSSDPVSRCVARCAVVQGSTVKLPFALLACLSSWQQHLATLAPKCRRHESLVLAALPAMCCCVLCVAAGLLGLRCGGYRTISSS
jgi:hypothetical protein